MTFRKELLQALMIWIPILTIFFVMPVVIWFARKRWPITTILLYSLWIMVIFTPIAFYIALYFGESDGIQLIEIPENILDLYIKGWPFWIFCAIMIISQMLLLIIPVKIVKKRPKPQRGIWVTAIVSATLFAIIIFGMVWSVIAAVFGDNGPGNTVIWLSLIFLLINWIAWSCIFRAFARNTDPCSYIHRLMKWLLRGTIIELLIAVPSHIIVRQKDVCCAHGITALGIATGLAVMLISFGPGIYFLYAERIQNKKPKKKTPTLAK